MADITIAKAGIRAVTTAQSDGTAAQKTGPSKFDNIRAQLANQLTHNFQLPASTPLSPQQTTNLETALRKRLSQAVATNPSDLFASDMKVARTSLNRLTAAVHKMPASRNAISIQDSLNSIETQYQQSAKLITGSKDMNLQSLLKMQAQLYRMGENIDLLSKVVDQVTSGVKTIFQTQVG